MNRSLFAPPSSISSMALMLMMVFLPMSDVRVVPSLMVAEFFAVVFVASVFAELLINPGKKIGGAIMMIFLVYFLAMICFLIIYFVSVVWDANVTPWGGESVFFDVYFTPALDYVSGYAAPELRNALVTIFNMCLLPMAMVLVGLRSMAELRAAILCLGLGCFYVLAHVVLAVANVVPMIDSYWWRFGRASGLTVHPNALGIVATMFVPIAMAVIWKRVSLIRIACAAGLLILAYQVVEYSGSRRAIVVFMALIVFGVLIWPNNVAARATRFLAVVCLGLVSVSSLAILRGVIPATPGTVWWRLFHGSSNADANREVLSAIAWEQAWASPLFGVGFEALTVAHNFFLQMFHIGGLLGLISYVALLVMPAIFVARELLRDVEIGPEVMVISSLLVNIYLTALTEASANDITHAAILGLAMVWSVKRYNLEGASSIRVNFHMLRTRSV